MSTSLESRSNAEFNALIRPYLVLTIGLSIAATIIGLPLALIWVCGVGQWWARHYFQKLECELDGKTLRYRKGILVQVEKTIPLENIQDVTFIEGPVLRHFQLSTLKFETAGHSAGQANEMKLTGIINAHEFRRRILEARDTLKLNNYQNHQTPALTTHDAALAAGQITALNGIEQRLDEIIRLLKNGR